MRTQKTIIETMIRIVTDSTCDLPEELIQNYGITVIPNILVINGQSYLDGMDISREEYYARMPQESVLPTTATSSAGTYLETYQNLIEKGVDHIISLHAASSLTGIYNAACAGAEQVKDKVTVIDSGQLSMGLGFQIIAAAKAISNGADIEDILTSINQTRKRLRVFALFDTLEYVKKSGRISWTRFHLASLLQIRPIIELSEGNIINQGEYRTRKKCIQKLSDFLNQMGSLESLAILHTNAKEDAIAFRQDRHVSSQDGIWICNVTTVIGTHVGPNALGFAAVAQNLPDPT